MNVAATAQNVTTIANSRATVANFDLPSLRDAGTLILAANCELMI